MKRNRSDDIFGLQPVGRRTTGRQDLGTGGFNDDGFGLDTTARDRWLLSYADLLTLLLAFFVVMYSISAVNEVKLVELAKSLSDTLNPDAEQPTTLLPTLEMNRLAVSEIPSIDMWLANANVKLQAVSIGEQSFSLTLPGEVLFDSGVSDLTIAGQQVLAAVLPMVLAANGHVRIEGHTDNQPIATKQYPSNWELSAHRAAAAVRFLELEGLPRAHLSAVGMADVMPVTSNDTAQGRKNNRRVVLHIAVQDWRVMNEFLRTSQTDFSASQVDTESLESPNHELLEFEDIDPELLEQILDAMGTDR